jgi:hypothetical protein
MAPLEPFPLPKRDYTRTDAYRVVTASSYRAIRRLVMLLIALQLITLAVLLAGVVR